MARLPKCMRPAPKPVTEIPRLEVDEEGLPVVDTELAYDYMITTNALADSARLLRDRIDYEIERPHGAETPLAERLRFATATRIVDKIANDLELGWQNYKPDTNQAHKDMPPQEARRHVLGRILKVTNAEFDTLSSLVGDAMLEAICQEDTPTRGVNRLGDAEQGVDEGVKLARRVVDEVFSELIADEPARGYDGMGQARDKAICAAIDMFNTQSEVNMPSAPDTTTLPGIFEYCYIGVAQSYMERALGLVAHGAGSGKPQDFDTHDRMPNLAMAGAVLSELRLPQYYDPKTHLEPYHGFEEVERLDRAESPAAIQFREIRRVAEVIKESLLSGELYSETIDKYQMLASSVFNDLASDGAPVTAEVVNPGARSVSRLMNGIIAGFHLQVRAADGHQVDLKDPYRQGPPRHFAIPLQFTRQ